MSQEVRMGQKFSTSQGRSKKLPNNIIPEPGGSPWPRHFLLVHPSARGASEGLIQYRCKLQYLVTRDGLFEDLQVF